MRRLYPILKTLLCLTLCLAVLSGCAGDGAGEQETIRIALFEPLSGPYAEGAREELRGIQLAHKLFPEALGRKVELVSFDNGSDADQALQTARSIVEDGAISAVIGSWGGSLSLAAAPVFEEAGLPAVTASCTNPRITGEGGTYFRVCPLDKDQGVALARYAHRVLGAQTAVLVVDNANAYSQTICDAFAQAFQELMGTEGCIVAEVAYQTGDEDFEGQIERILAAHPDVCVLPGGATESATLLRQARNMGVDCAFLGGDIWEKPEFLELAGESAEGVVFPVFFDVSADLEGQGQEFARAYRQEYGEEPTAAAALGYDAYCLVLDTIGRANSSKPSELCDALANMEEYAGATGVFRFNERGDALKSRLALRTVRGGEFAYQDTILLD